jgi:hypothetical protein
LKGVVAVEILERGDEKTVGQLARLTWRSALPH